MKAWVGRFEKENLDSFVKSLKCDIYAPVKKQEIMFDKINC